MGLIELLVAVIVIAIIYWILTLLPLPQPVKNIVIAVVLLICLLWLLGAFGILPGFRLRG